jgi:hypothetical protein
MNRLILCLPAFTVSLPILIVLLVTPPPSYDLDNIQIDDRSPELVDNSNGGEDTAGMEKLAREDPIAFLEKCILRYRKEVHGYTLIMRKQEFIGGALHPKEVVEVAFREHPHSVYLRWIDGAGKAERALYVEGENNGRMLSRPCGELARKLAGDIVEVDVEGVLARQSGRFTLNKYGINKGTERYLASWKTAQDHHVLDVEYLGILPLAEVANRPCFTFRRECRQPENDGVMEQTLFVDKESWLQLGSIIRGAGGKLIGEYYFQDIRLNPEFKPDQFKPAALRPAT